jgi:hypothetical protein
MKKTFFVKGWEIDLVDIRSVISFASAARYAGMKVLG